MEEREESKVERPRIINRRTALYGLAIGGAAIGSLLAAEGVVALDRAMKPKFVLKGNPAPPMDEKPEWRRPTSWVEVEIRRK